MRPAPVRGVIATLSLAIAAGTVTAAVPAAAQGPAAQGPAARVAAAPAGTFAPGGILNDIVASSAQNAWAVGHGGACHPTSEIARWNGTNWKMAQLPASARSGWLNGVTATSDADAWAVGFAGSLDGPLDSLILHWNGRNQKWWRAIPPGAAGGIDLGGVAAVTPSNVWAVGETGRGNTVILHWNGQVWKRVPSPSPSYSFLNGITAVSARNIWAVGGDLTTSLIVHWNGIRWSRVPVPGLPAGSALDAITATSAGNAWAVGSAWQHRVMILRWNGVTWKQVAIPNIRGELSGVTALSANNAWAVGATYNLFHIGCAGFSAKAGRPGTALGLSGVGPAASPPFHAVILHWNGTAWIRVKSPHEPDAVLSGVAIPKAGTAFAVGGTHFFEPNGKILVLRWNGRTWQ
jgi:hypothetical protein